MAGTISVEELEQSLHVAPPPEPIPASVPELLLHPQASDPVQVRRPPQDPRKRTIQRLTRDAQKVIDDVVELEENSKMLIKWFSWVSGIISHKRCVTPGMPLPELFYCPKVYGSYQTGIITRGADLDCTILLVDPIGRIAQVPETESMDRPAMKSLILSRVAEALFEEAVQQGLARRRKAKVLFRRPGQSPPPAPASDAADEAEAAPPAFQHRLIANCRIPVLKLTFEGQYEVDVTLNNYLPIANSSLIAEYIAVNPACRELALIVKHWARKRDINCAYRNTLSSYAYTMLVIFYLQTRRAPLLPALQGDFIAPRPDLSGQYNVAFMSRDYAWEMHGGYAPAPRGLGELLYGFFKFYAYEFDHHTFVVSPRRAGPLTRDEKGWDTVVYRTFEGDVVTDFDQFAECDELRAERHLFAIEDPFELDRDLSGVVTEDAYRCIFAEFRRACAVLRKPKGGIRRLLLDTATDPHHAQAPRHAQRQ